MDLATIIKILIRHIKLLVAVPLVLVLLVLLGTRNQEREYSSELSIYTGIASGFSIGSVEGSPRVDMFNTNNQFDNFINIIKSKETSEEVALRLLAQNLTLTKPDVLYISPQNYKKLQAAIPRDVKVLMVKGSVEQSYQKLLAYKNSSSENYLVGLLSSNDPHYSFSAISKIGIKRIGNSDLVNVSYQNNDPGITYQTLKILSEVFILNYKRIKQSQTDAVVKYFERELDKVSVKLRQAEDKLLEYYKSNSVINYNEQTRYIAEQKEYLESDYVREKMSFASTKASANQLESKINIRDRLFLKNDSIVRFRDELYKLNLKKAENLLSFRDSAARNSGISAKNSSYQKQIERVTNQLNDEVTGAMRMKNSVEGIAMDKILTSWLDYVVANEASRAKLDVMKSRFKEFEGIYQTLAPVGATIKRIEREIEINEQQYLSILHGLNMAKLRMQDVEMSSNIKVLDEPYYPLKPLASKKKMLLIAAFMGGLLLIVAIILAFEYIDSSIRTADRAAKLTRQKVLGIFPYLYKNTAWLEEVAERLAVITAQDVANHITTSPLRVGVISTTDSEGKSTIIDRLCAALTKLGYTSLSVDDKNQHNHSLPGHDAHFNVIFYELPSILLSPVSSETAATMGLFLLVVRANREWKPADRRALNMFVETSEVKPLIILNGVEEDGLEHYLGSLPKSRSRFRAWMKKVLAFNFFGRNKF